MRHIKLFSKENSMPRCHDCNCQKGELHVPGCDWEVCPFCLGQLIGCDCCYEILNIDSSKEPVYSQGLNEEQSSEWEKVLKEKGKIPYSSEKEIIIKNIGLLECSGDFKEARVWKKRLSKGGIEL